MDIECDIGVGVHSRRQSPRLIGTEPAPLIDVGELHRLAKRFVDQRLALAIDLSHDQLVLSGDRDVFTGRHRDGAGQQTGHTRDTNERGIGGRAGEPENQRNIRHEPVADTEHRGTRPPTLHVAVVVEHAGLECHRLQSNQAFGDEKSVAQ